jgi:hypothetical protein
VDFPHRKMLAARTFLVSSAVRMDVFTGDRPRALHLESGIAAAQNFRLLPP